MRSPQKRHPPAVQSAQASAPNRASAILRVYRGEWSKLAMFALFGLMLQIGMGVATSAGDAAFLSHAGAQRLPLIFLLIPAVMLVYTPVFSLLIARFGIGRVADITLVLLAVGGVAMATVVRQAEDVPGEIAP